MNKTELVEAVAESAELTKASAAKAVDSVLDVIVKALADGDQVGIPGFGTFLTGNRAAREGRNPQTGETIQIKAARVVKFKVGKALKEKVAEA